MKESANEKSSRLGASLGCADSSARGAADVQSGPSSPAGQGESGEVGLADGLPAGWAATTVGEFCTIKGGKRLPKGKTYSDEPTAHAYIRVSDFDRGGIDQSNLRYISQEVHEAISRYVISKNDVYISIAGTIGLVGQVPPELDGANLTENAAKMTLGDGIHPPFFRHLFSSPDVQEQIGFTTIATTQPKLALFRIEALNVPIPPKAEQIRIVSAIESLQERSARAKEALCEVGPLLSQLRQSVLRGAFSGRLTERWRTENTNVEPASELLARIRTERRERWEAAQLAKYEAKGKQPPKNWQGKYKEPEPVDESELEELPDGWCWVTLDELAEKVQDGNYGGSYPKKDEWEESGVPFLTPAAINTSGEIVVEKVKYVSEEKNATLTKAQLQKGDVIFPNRGSRDAQRMGKQPFAIEVPNQWSHSNINPQLTLVRSVTSVSSEYLSLAMNSDVFLAQVRQATGGSALAFFNLATTKEMCIPVAPQLEQERICELVGEALHGVASVSAIQASSEAELTQLDQSILAKAFRGELVPQDPSDEPASQLLHRIRTTRAQLEAEKKAAKKKSKKKATRKKNSKV